MNSVIKKLQQNERLVKIAPWFAGASLGLCHVAMSSNCSVTREGHCSSCGSCVIALGALVGWALMDKSRRLDRESRQQSGDRESDSHHTP